MRRGARLPQSSDRLTSTTRRPMTSGQSDLGDRPAEFGALAREKLTREVDLHEVETGRAQDLAERFVGALRVTGALPLHREVEERLGLLRRRRCRKGEIGSFDLADPERGDASDPS